jgi:protein ImuB
MSLLPTISSPQRILALWLPLLSTERIFRHRFGKSWRSRLPRGTPPLVVSHREDNTQRIAALDARASALRLRTGMGIADARAMHPAIEVVEAEPQADRKLLESIADWCDRYTPLVALEGDEGLFLDITGCAHLFGGERALLDDLLSRLHHQGFEARAGLASTPGAAWAAARCHGARIVPPGEEADLLAPMPLAALRLNPDICTGLEGVGLRTVGALMRIPRAPLVRRFGKEMALCLDQALGHVEEAISPRLPVPALSVERQLAEPISLIEDIEELLFLLAKSLKTDLERRGEGAERLQLLLFRVDGAVSRIAVGASRPLRDPSIIRKLFHERLTTLGDEIDAGCGFELIRLSALVVARLDAAQTDLDSRSASQDADVALFADRVMARLGSASLLCPVPVESHIPERAVNLVAFPEARRGKQKQPSENPFALPERPVRLFPHPDPVDMVSMREFTFRWRRTIYKGVRVEGPERIAPEWWRDEGEAATRDYFRVEDEDGRRYWLFREDRLSVLENRERWFMHGLFA